MKIRHLTATATLALMVAPAVHAQQLEEIVVTAQKRSENMQSVPIAVSAVTAQAAEAAGIKGSADLQFAVPGLNVTRTSAATVFNLRGVGTQGGSTGQDSAIATFVDGVYIPAMDAATFSLNNIARMEVLKGPQGTLYGRNATGGAINIITKDPSHEASLDGEMGFGNLKTMEGRLYVTGGLTDTIAADLAVYYRDQGEGFGYDRTIQRDVNKSKDFGVRSKLLWDISDDLKFTLAGDYSYTGGSIGIAYRAVPSSNLVNGQVGYTGGYWDSTSEFMPNYYTKTMGGSGKFEYKFGDFTLMSLTAYRYLDAFQRVDVDATSLKFIDAPLYSNTGQLTQEFQLGYQGNRLKAVGGLFYLDSYNKYDPFQIFGIAISSAAPGAINVRTDSRQDSKSYAAFGQATYEIFDDTNITVGGRYTRDERKLSAISYINIAGTFIPTATRNEKKTFSKPTWRFAIDHKITPETMIYASYSRGFKSGVFNLTNLDPVRQPAVLPETLDAFELGVKSDLFDRRLRLNVSGFYYNYKNIQLFQVVGADTILSNAAKAQIYGIDVDFSAAVTDRLTLTGGGEWLHDRYKKLLCTTILNPSPIPGGVNVQTPCSTPPVPGNPGDVSGNRLVNVPDWTFNASANYKMPLADGELAGNLSWAYNDGFFWSAQNRTSQKSYSLVNAQLQWTAPSKKWYVRAFGKNVLNKKYLATLNENNTGDIGSPAAGRTYGMLVGVHL